MHDRYLLSLPHLLNRKCSLDNSANESKSSRFCSPWVYPYRMIRVSSNHLSSPAAPPPSSDKGVSSASSSSETPCEDVTSSDLGRFNPGQYGRWHRHCTPSGSTHVSLCSRTTTMFCRALVARAQRFSSIRVDDVTLP